MKEKIYYFIVLALLLTCNSFAQISGHKHTYYYVMTESYKNDAPRPFSDESCYYTFSNEWCYESDADGRASENAYRYRGNKDGYKWYSMGIQLAGMGWKWFPEHHLFVTSDNSEIRKVFDLSDQGIIYVKVWKRSNPSNNRNSGSNRSNRSNRSNNSPTYTPPTYTPPSSYNQKKRVERTCSHCNGTGLTYYYDALTHIHTCTDIYCNKCGKKHCTACTHQNCVWCDGTGKIVSYEY